MRYKCVEDVPVKLCRKQVLMAVFQTAVTARRYWLYHISLVASLGVIREQLSAITMIMIYTQPYLQITHNCLLPVSKYTGVITTQVFTILLL